VAQLAALTVIATTNNYTPSRGFNDFRFAAVAAHQSMDIKPYHGAVRWSAFFTGSSRMEIKRLLTPVRGVWMIAFHWMT
jgi:hypothetical protein